MTTSLRFLAPAFLIIAGLLAPLDSGACAATLNSHYVPMRDGVRLAVDVHLPENAGPGARVPAILHLTKYMRRLDILFPFQGVDAGRRREAEAFVAAGYAWVNVDVRGSGASFGVRPSDFAPDEIADGRDLIDWIVRQPWSNGRVGATGVSYPAAAADHLATLGHPALKAIAPRYIFYDPYADLFYPGGLPNTWFIGRYDEVTAALDRNDIGSALGFLYEAVIRGVAPVDGDDGRELLSQALSARPQNWRVAETLERITYRDDPGPGGRTFALGGVGPLADRMRRSGVAIYSLSGWFDGAYVSGAIRRFRAVPNAGSVLRIGPWVHAGTQALNPAGRSRASAFDETSDVIAFFDRHLKDGGQAPEEPVVFYYLMGLEAWRRSPEWPPVTRALPLYFRDGGVLGDTPTSGTDLYAPDAGATSGTRSRWRSIINPTDDSMGYSGWSAQSRRRLAYESAPLAADVAVVGHPVVELHAAFDDADAAVFAYLEVVLPDGDIRYVTEGQLRARHRKLAPEGTPNTIPAPYRSFVRADAAPLTPGEPAILTFDLLPTAFVFAKGQRIRISFAGADTDNFGVIPDAAGRWTIFRSTAQPSRIVLPVDMSE